MTFSSAVILLAVLALVLTVIQYQKVTHMTIVSTRNPGHLTHQDCGGGIVTHTTDHAIRQSTITCAGCGAKAEFDSIYSTYSFRFIKEDGKERKVPLRRYRDAPMKGRLRIISPPAH
ncbi:hypothetical protein HY839_02870 [Candidatus Azambacteria bacterium]|nr:hypothetical protein [Candidatus Azambacteria bacterium]